MKNATEIIQKFIKDYQYHLRKYFKASDEINQNYHRISASVYEKVLKEMGMTKEETDKIVDDIRELVRQ